MSGTKEAVLILNDGTIFRGRSIGAEGEAGGEVVFNTSLTGYQEVITDPSYCGQIVTMTAPLIGNYGTNLEDEEAAKPHLSGFVVRELSTLASNFRSTSSLDSYLRRHGIVAMDGVDTRALTRRLRSDGSMKGLITTRLGDLAELKRRLAAVPELEGRDLVLEVTRGKRIAWTEGYAEAFRPDLSAPTGWERPKVVALDYGAKANIFRSLVASGFEVIVLPAGASANDVMAERPDGVFLSNGPGDPRVLRYAVDCAKGVLGKVPVFGICLGHQILGAALGAKVFKLKFGHHGGNQPVRDQMTGRVEITAQNHGFAVEEESLVAAGGRVTHINLNDGTVEGLDHPGLRMMAVQYHPEAAPGPHDSLYLFRRFRTLVRPDGAGIPARSGN